MANWDRELFNKRRYDAVFESLLSRATESPRLFQSAPVYPELSLLWTLRNKDLVLKNLFTSLRKGELLLSPQTLVKIKTDKVRDIYQANWPERILLMVMANILKERTDALVGPNVYSFRKGRGPWTALRALSEYVAESRRRHPRLPVTVLKRDIKKYGDTIPQDKLFAQLLERSDLSADSIFFELLKQGVRVTFATKERPDAQASLRLGIPSGSPLVPPLENFYLVPLDETLGKIPDLFYGRYGDDFVCASALETRIATAIEQMRLCVAALGLKTKVEKEQDLRLGAQLSSGVTWLGSRISFRGEIGLKLEHHREIRRVIRMRLREIVAKVARFEISHDIRIEVLGRALRGLLDPKTQDAVRRLIHDNNNVSLLSDIDRDLYRWLVSDLQQLWKMRKKAAWKIARKVRIPSLRYLKNPDPRRGKKKNGLHQDAA
jgi:hypothetical protein